MQQFKMVGLKERQKETENTYPGTMRHELNIALALIHDPEILIIDESTVGIDRSGCFNERKSQRKLS